MRKGRKKKRKTPAAAGSQTPSLKRESKRNVAETAYACQLVAGKRILPQQHRAGLESSYAKLDGLLDRPEDGDARSRSRENR